MSVMIKYLFAGILLVAAVPASAATYVVLAGAHSINGGSGTGLATGLTFNAGDYLRVSSSTNDLWSAGALPRYSDANGLIAPRFATPADDSGQPTGTLIGNNFGTPTFDGYTAPYGSLVGRYGDGTYQLLGANYLGTAAGTGDLTLFYWDDFTGDNFGEITFDISAVPEPSTWAMMILGIGLAGAALRRRTRVTVSYA